MILPGYVTELMDRLEDAGFEAWAVGGCVRDDALGIEPHDYDLCTSALPEQTQALFPDRDLVLAGVKHGTVGIVTDFGVVEITTFRTEGDYSDRRHPGWVRFEDRIEADLSRRDFTVNAMAYSPRRGYCDPFGGRRDLKRGILRTVGEARTRFSEDPLRILRGARFAVRFRLRIQPETKVSMFALRGLLDGLARERVFSELSQFLTLAEPEDILEMEPLLTQVIPELGPCVGFDQRNPNHAYDVFGHIARVTGRLPKEPVLRFAGMLHDISKPRCMTLDDRGRGHFYGHAGTSGEIAEAVLRGLKASNEFREDVVWLVRHHMDLWEPEPKQVRRALSRHGIRRIRMLCALQRADVWGKGTGKNPKVQAIADFLALAQELEGKEGALTLKTLEVKGDDLMALGYPRAKVLGQTLQRLLEQVMAGQVPNEKEALLALARQWLAEI